MKIKAVVLAAGRSNRLLPLTKSTPKPMLLVGGKPFMSYVIEWLHKNDVKDILVTLHYCPEKIINYFGDGSNFGVKITYSFEEKLLDTAGSLKKNERFLTSDFLVLSGSYYLSRMSFVDFYSFHLKKGGVGTIAFKFIKDRNLLKDFGQGVFDKENKLIGFEEKPGRIISNFVHTTYQIYSPRILNYIPVNTVFSLPKDLLPLLLNVGEPIYGYTQLSKIPLINISTKKMYKTAKKFMEDKNRT